jgi:hypothetical protein
MADERVRFVASALVTAAAMLAQDVPPWRGCTGHRFRVQPSPRLHSQPKQLTSLHIMPTSCRRPALALTVLVAAAATLVAANFELSVTADTRKTFEFGSFGYAADGVVAISLRSFSVAGYDSAVPLPNSPPIGFTLDSVDSAQTARSEREFSKATAPCFIDDPRLAPPDGLRYTIFLNGSAPRDVIASAAAAAATGTASAPRINGAPAGSLSRTVTKRGYYGLFFFNCMLPAGVTAGPSSSPPTSRAPPAVTMSLRVDQFNVDAAGSPDYLSHGDGPLGAIYVFFCAVFAALFALWRSWLAGKSRHVKRVHHIVEFLLVIKCLSLLFETIKYFHYARTGERGLWDFFYYVFVTLKGVTLFAVIVLLGSGWSSAKAFLSQHDRALLWLVLPAQVLINVMIAVLDETSEGNWWWGRVLDALRFLDVVCVLAVLLPLVWSMKTLSERAQTEEEATRTLRRMATFRTFYLVFVAYVYMTRVVVVVVVASAPFYMMWIAALLRESCAVALYAYICVAFRPGEEGSGYSVIELWGEGGDGGGADGGDAAAPRVTTDMQEMESREELAPAGA